MDRELTEEERLRKLEWGADDFVKRFGEVIIKMSEE